MAKTKWKRKLGTSKREQGIITPKAPQNRRKQPIIPVVKLVWWKRLLRKLWARP